jgi:cell division protein FtsI (penicillin-binding protein 3)
LYKGRLILVFFFVIVLWSLMFVRGGYLQFNKNLPIAEIKQKQFNRMIRLAPRRGDILDREGKELAVSVTAYSLFADPAIIENPSEVAKKIASHFKVSYRPIFMKISKKSRRFVWIRRRLDRKDYETIKSWGIRGLAFKEEFKRVYPGESLAAPVLGFVGREQQGLSGLELQYENLLSGAGRQVRVQRDARGRVLVKDGHLFASSPGGADLILTLDKDLQFWVESQLQNAVKEHRAEAAWAVVLNPTNSEILAMANYPGFDANAATKFSGQRRRNKSVHDMFESGSVMKAVTVGGALGANIVEPNTKINTENGHFKIGKRVIREADKKHSFKELSVTDILAHSSNVGTSKIALMMKDQGLFRTLKDFGFGEKTGVDLPGEAKGLLSSPPWRDHLTANISFGHGVAVTALQVANAYAAIANGGTLNRPHLVKEVRDLESEQDKVLPQSPGRRVLSAKDAHMLKMMLSSVVHEGRSGYLARVDGFPVAGKTGTAQKVDPNGRGYLKGHYISSFAGFVPANDPKYVIYVVVDSPQKKDYYASTVAAPIFRNIAQYALRKDRQVPVYIAEADLIRGIQSPPGEEKKKNVRHKKALRQISPQLKSLERVPELSGLTLREVLSRLQGADVDLEVKGEGRVRRTDPPAGRQFSRGKLRVELEPESLNQ